MAKKIFRTRAGRILRVLGWSLLGGMVISWGPQAVAQSAVERYGRDIYWNATPNDINNLLKQMSQQVDAHYQMEIQTLEEVSPQAEENPILYRSGHYAFEYSPAERRKLREYLLGGGMIVYNTGLGSMPFYRSVVAELKEIFPEQPLQRLSSDHPIFHSYYDVDRVNYTPAVAASGFRGNEPWFDAIEINCRVVALVSRWGLAVGWQGEVKDSYQAYQPESAFRLGVNIVTYASSMRAWANNAAHSMSFVDEQAAGSDKVFVGQVVYDGVWKTRHAGLPVLLQTFNRRTGVPVKFAMQDLRLTDPRLFNAPLLYITGHEHFELSEKEVQGLRQYLENGGFLFAEACCGRKGFDLAFRQTMRRVLPGKTLERINTNSILFKEPNPIQTVGVTPSLVQELGAASTSPSVEGVDMGGYYGVIYSRLGLAGGWELSQSPYARGYNNASAVKLGQNVLMYSVTQ